MQNIPEDKSTKRLSKIETHQIKAKTSSAPQIVLCRIVADHYTEAAHKHNYYQLLFFRQGKGSHEIDFQSYPIEPYSLHFVHCGQVHCLHLQGDVVGRGILFSEEALPSENLHRLKQSFEQKIPVLSLQADFFAFCEDCLAKMVDEQQALNSFELLKNYLQIILIQLERYVQANIDSTETAATKRLSATATAFVQLAQTHCLQQHNLAFYAQMLHIHPVYLNEICQLELYETALQYLQNRILVEAKRLLVYTDQSIKAIAYECGFDDPAYFTRWFKKKQGTTPLEYKKQIVL